MMIQTKAHRIPEDIHEPLRHASSVWVLILSDGFGDLSRNEVALFPAWSSGDSHHLWAVMGNAVAPQPFDPKENEVVIVTRDMGLIAEGIGLAVRPGRTWSAYSIGASPGKSSRGVRFLLSVQEPASGTSDVRNEDEEKLKREKLKRERLKLERLKKIEEAARAQFRELWKAQRVETKPLGALASEIVEINRANGWTVTTPETWDGEDANKIPAVLALIHSEVSEALEGYRAHDRINFEEELADVVIRVLDLAGGMGIDLDFAVAAKLVKNRTRGFRHGGKRV